MAWDRPLLLNRPLIQGGRVQAHALPSAPGALPEGRLGGGGSNAAAALLNAGHTATVASAVPSGSVGDQILAQASSLGIDTRFVARTHDVAGATLLLIDPEGERTILRVLSEDQDRSAKLSAVMDAFSGAFRNSWKTSAYESIYLRIGQAPDDIDLKGFNGTILTHGPLSQETPSDYVVTSRDDLENAGTDEASYFARTRALAANRLKALIVTDGASGGVAITAEGRTPYSSPQVRQVDATGAGDCFAAGFLDAITTGADLHAALSHGAAWGAETAARMGSALCPAEQIYKPFEQTGARA